MLRYVFFSIAILSLGAKALAVETVTYDDPANCSENQLVLEAGLNRVPDIFRLPRTPVTGELSRTCVNYVLRNGGFTYATCSSRDAQPVYHGMGNAFRECVTSNYFNSIYNTYADIMDCLEIDPRLLLPKLFVESGLHINSFNRTGFDSGVGQLTTPAIEDVIQDGFDIRAGRVQASTKASCQRIAAIPGIFTEPSSERAHRCQFIDPGVNPARNILFTGFYTMVLKKRLRVHMRNSEIMAKLATAGLASASEENVINMLAMLAYNVGPSSAVTYLEAYLDARIAKIRAGRGTAVTTADFNAVTNAADDFTVFRDVNSHYGQDHAYGDNALVRAGVQNVTFPRYMIYVQDIGGRGYLTHLARMKIRLDQNTEENLCSTADFLRL